MTQQAHLRRISGCLVTMQMAVDLSASDSIDDAELWATLEEQTQKMAFIVIQADGNGLSEDDDEGIEPEFDFDDDDLEEAAQ